MDFARAELLLEWDRRFVWHPYAAIPASPPPLLVSSARGARLRLADGRELIDAMASWWCAIHGYAHPTLDAAVRGQLDSMAHVMFGGLTHEPAVRLATRLSELTPSRLERVFFADSGSVAVEVAIKMALQYWQARDRPERHRLLTVRGGYHGDTFGAMAVCDPIDGVHSLFTGVVPVHVFAPRPPAGFDTPLDDAYEAQLTRAFEYHGPELAAVIIEPVVQGAGGMRFYSPQILALLRALCDQYGLLLILDEIATGFGRTGKLFACEQAPVAPDIMCVGKALTGGYLPLAATISSAEVADVISHGKDRVLMHGPTYMANPLACAVGLASLELLTYGAWREVARIERGLAAGLETARDIPGVLDARVLGAIAVIQVDRPVDLAAATQAAVDRGVWLRPFRDLVYAMPPYICSDEEVAQITGGMLAAARAA